MKLEQITETTSNNIYLAIYFTVRLGDIIRAKYVLCDNKQNPLTRMVTINRSPVAQESAGDLYAYSKPIVLLPWKQLFALKDEQAFQVIRHAIKKKISQSGVEEIVDPILRKPVPIELSKITDMPPELNWDLSNRLSNLFKYLELELRPINNDKNFTEKRPI